MKCQECGTSITGRKDKRFCSDACRVFYHNKTSAHFNTFKRKINKLLQQNRSILKKLHDIGIKTITVAELITVSFNFDYHTSTFNSSSSKLYYYCYDYGYCFLSDDKVLIVKSRKKGV